MPLAPLTLHDNVAVIHLDNPPVNSGGVSQRRELLASLDAAAQMDGILGIVVTTAGKHFYAGSDLREFDTGIQQPTLPEVIQKMEGMTVPIVAAIRGSALGGGLEFALACDARVATRDARLGFPESTLGIIPGAGGTVRAAILLGFPQAATLVASGETLSAARAHEIGLVDRLCGTDEDLLTKAIEILQSLKRCRRPILERKWPELGEEDMLAVRENLPAKARPNAIAALELMLQAQRTRHVPSALAAERRLFLELLDSEEAKNLRYLFFAKKAARQALRGAPGAPLQHVGIAGAGTMGLALAKAVQSAGLKVTVYDLNAAARERVSTAVPGATVIDDLSGFSHVDLLLDAVFEDLEVKRALFAMVEPHLSDTAVLASNTSYLDLDSIAEVMGRPERFIGLHFFNPPGRNPLVEIIPASATGGETVGTAIQLASILGKVAIPAGMGDGFVANRVYADYRNQAEFLLEDGATPREVDQAMEKFGLPVGPFAVADMSGLDIAWARRKRLAPTRSPNQRYVKIPDALCEIGRLGKKTGRGWYDYPAGARRGVEAEEVTEIIRLQRAVAGITPRPISDEEIQQRIIGSMLCAAASLMELGIAARGSDIDVAFTEGFAFPKWLGGPLRYAASRPTSWIVDALIATHLSCPVTYQIAKPGRRNEIPAVLEMVLASVR